MQLSDGEKIIISMLADIHKHLGINGGVDAKRLEASLFSDNLWSLKWDYSGLFGGSEPSEETIKQTADILQMWEILETSYSSLGAADKAAVDAANGGRAPKFLGFDGNNERHFGVARHFVDDMDRFDHFSGRDLNSHSPSVHRNLRRLDEFTAAFGNLGAASLSADQISQILNA